MLYILGLTGTESGRQFLYSHPDITTTIIKLTIHKNTDVVKSAVSYLVNLTTVTEGAEFLLTEVIIYMFKECLAVCVMFCITNASSFTLAA